MRKTNKSTSYFIGLATLLLFTLSTFGALARDACFENWFCVSLKPEKDQFRIELQRIAPFPVVVTLADMPDTNRSDTRSFQLDHDNPIVVDTTTSERRFWRNMTARWTAGVLNAQHDRSASYYYPAMSRSQYRIVQGFNGGYSHRGPDRYAVDIAMPVGTPIYAARDGIVISLEERHNRGGASSRYGKYANYIIVLHDDNTTGEYFHLKQNGVVVERGQRVVAGEMIGYSGNTGFSSMPHLHFGVYYAKTNGKYQSVPFSFTEYQRKAP